MTGLRVLLPFLLLSFLFLVLLTALLYHLMMKRLQGILDGAKKEEEKKSGASASSGEAGAGKVSPEETSPGNKERDLP